MSGQPKDGGPAFPFGEREYDGGNHYLGTRYDPGMSLRDWFAGQALAGMVGTVKTEEHTRKIGIAAYAVADIMLAARGAA